MVTGFLTRTSGSGETRKPKRMLFAGGGRQTPVQARTSRKDDEDFVERYGRRYYSNQDINVGGDECRYGMALNNYDQQPQATYELESTNRPVSRWYMMSSSSSSSSSPPSPNQPAQEYYRRGDESGYVWDHDDAFDEQQPTSSSSDRSGLFTRLADRWHERRLRRRQRQQQKPQSASKWSFLPLSRPTSKTLVVDTPPMTAVKPDLREEYQRYLPARQQQPTAQSKSAVTVVQSSHDLLRENMERCKQGPPTVELVDNGSVPLPTAEAGIRDIGSELNAQDTMIITAATAASSSNITSSVDQDTVVVNEHHETDESLMLIGGGAGDIETTALTVVEAQQDANTSDQ